MYSNNGRVGTCGDGTSVESDNTNLAVLDYTLSQASVRDRATESRIKLTYHLHNETGPLSVSGVSGSGKRAMN